MTDTLTTRPMRQLSPKQQTDCGQEMVSSGQQLAENLCRLKTLKSKDTESRHVNAVWQRYWVSTCQCHVSKTLSLNMSMPCVKDTESQHVNAVWQRHWVSTCQCHVAKTLSLNMSMPCVKDTESQHVNVMWQRHWVSACQCRVAKTLSLNMSVPCVRHWVSTCQCHVAKTLSLNMSMPNGSQNGMALSVVHTEVRVKFRRLALRWVWGICGESCLYCWCEIHETCIWVGLRYLWWILSLLLVWNSWDLYLGGFEVFMVSPVFAVGVKFMRLVFGWVWGICG